MLTQTDGQGREYVTEGHNEHLSPIMNHLWDLDDNACASSFDSFKYYPIIVNYSVNSRPAVPFGGSMLTGGDPSVFN